MNDQRSASVMSQLTRFGSEAGLSISPEVLLDPDIVEAFVVRGLPGRAHSTKGTYRSVLSRLAGEGARRPKRRGTPFSAAPAPAPYCGAERAELEAIARAQPRLERGRSARVVLAGGIGAGLRPLEIVALRADDVVSDGNQVSVKVRAAFERLVPLSPPHGERLAELAALSAGGLLFRPGLVVRDYKNALNDLCCHLDCDPQATKLSAPRCRASFICDHLAAGTTLSELCAIAGLCEPESLLRYCRHVEGAPQSKAALRARARAESLR